MLERGVERREGRMSTNLGGEGREIEKGKDGGKGELAGKGHELIALYDIELLLRVRWFIIIILTTYEIPEIEVCYPDILGA